MYVTHQPPPVAAKKEPVNLPTVETMQNLIKSGCSDVVQQLIDQHKLPYKIKDGKLEDALFGTDKWLSKFITTDPACQALKQRVVKLAACPDEVLITGETGTGKEILARAMIGVRTGDFVAINCAGLPEYLIESELFGHVKGAFTGAESQKQGLFARASGKDGGVLFLDEIGELPIGVQAKLLRAIQDKVIRKVGANVEEEINCKFVCATHRDLQKMQEQGTFREDLYARISTFEVHIPPLRDRVPEDIEAIIRNEIGGVKFLDAMRQQDKRLGDINLRYNVRSLQRCVKRYNVLGEVILS